MGAKDSAFNFSAKQMESFVLNGERCTKLSGNVQFSVEQGTMYAPVAYYFNKRNVIKAEKHVKLVFPKEGVTVEANCFSYDRKKAMVHLTGNVTWKSKDNQTLRAARLIYDVRNEALTFEEKVKLTDKRYILDCDVLHYNTVTKIARFRGAPASIVNKDRKEGLKTKQWVEYNTTSQSSNLSQGVVETDQYELRGDKLVLDQARECYKVMGNVRLVSKKEGLEITGDYAFYRKKEGIAKLYGNALLKKTLRESPLYLSADHFLFTENQSSRHGEDYTISASENVQIYQKDFRGKAEKLVYREAEGKLHFEGNTIFWAGDNQLTADKSYVLLKDRVMQALHMKSNVLIVSKDKGGHFNQLKSKNMIVHFDHNVPQRVVLSDNVESVYFLRGGEGKLEGVNHMKCSQVTAILQKSKIANMTIPSGACSKWEVHPPAKFPKTLTKIADFKWRMAERPTQQDVVGHGYGNQKGYTQFKFDEQPAGNGNKKKLTK